MDNEEYLEILDSHRMSKIQAVLESDYIPKTLDEIKKLTSVLQISSTSNRRLQNLALNKALRVDQSIALDLLAWLAQNSFDETSRWQTIEKIIQIEQQDDNTYQALFNCCQDESTRIQCAALRGLSGWLNEDAITLLIDRMQNPTVPLHDDDGRGANNIQSAAIQGLSTAEAKQAIQPLVDYMSESPDHRPHVINSLVTIGGTDVVEMLLLATENTDTNEVLDESFMLDAALIIARLEIENRQFKQGQLNRYRHLLGEVFEAAMRNHSHYIHIIDATKRYLNQELADTIQPFLQSQLSSSHVHHTLVRIDTPLLIERFPYWKYNNKAKEYLSRLWNITNDYHQEIVNSLFDVSQNDAQAIEQAASFIAGRWKDVLDEQEGFRVIDQVVTEWQQSNSQRQRVIEAILRKVPPHSAEPAAWVETIVNYAPLEPNDPLRNLIDSALEEAHEDQILVAKKQYLSQQWNIWVLDDVINLEPVAGEHYIRKKLWEENVELPEDHRVWAIKQFGKLGTHGDFENLAKEIEGHSEKCAVAAIKAIEKIDAEAGQSLLRDALNTRKDEVVIAALEVLRSIKELHVETIHRLQEKTRSDEKNPSVRSLAQEVLNEQKDRHLSERPSVNEPLHVIDKWLEILRTFESDEPSCDALASMLTELGNSDAVELRQSIGRVVPDCCPPDKGMTLIDQELEDNRNREVLAVWEDASDRIRGLPDRSILNLIERVCNTELDRAEILGGHSLTDIVVDPNETLHGLSMHLRYAERLTLDALVVQLDAIAELLIDEVFQVEGEDPRRFDNYSNKIGSVKKHNARVFQTADNLHNLREIARLPHVRDKSHQLRQGVNDQDVDGAKKYFTELFKETIRHLRAKKKLK